MHPPVLGEHPRIVLQPDLDDAIAFALWELAVNDEEPLADNDFSLSVNPTAVSVQAGQSVTATVASAVTEGGPQAVTLGASGLPPGATAMFDPASFQSGGSATLTIATGAGTPNGTTPVTITADGADVDHTVRLTLTVGTGTPPDCDAPAWTATTAYVTGDVVSHNGRKWESTWYSTGAEPGAPGSWAVWRDAGPC